MSQAPRRKTTSSRGRSAGAALSRQGVASPASAAAPSSWRRVDIIGRGSERIMDLLRMSEDIGQPARALQPRMNSGADSSSALRSCGVRT